MKGRGLTDILGTIKEEGGQERKTIEAAEKAAEIIFELSEARIKKGLSQRQLAALTGIPLPNIAKIEAAKIMPRLDTLMKIAVCVGVEIKMEEQEVYTVAFEPANNVYKYEETCWTNQYSAMPVPLMGV